MADELRLEDIQGLLLRDYHLPHLRLFVLQVDEAAKARAVVGALITGRGALLPVTNAELSPQKPDATLNIGFTHKGLQALEIGEFSFERSFKAFVDGAVSRAEAVGDTGRSAPESWTAGLQDADSVHAVVHLFTKTAETREEQSQALRELLDGGAFRVLGSLDGDALPRGEVHFGYRDGMSQPRIKGLPGNPPADCQQELEAWKFVVQEADDSIFYVPEPAVLGLNGGFGAFRVLAQDVAGFERFLDSNAALLDRELLAAKMCGRWRNGVPLMLSPDTDQPEQSISEEDMNAFDYVKAKGYGGPTDPKGVKCPITSHIRRNNPRSQRVAGDTSLHRVFRRGIPYGPPYDPEHPDDGIERGLMVLFAGVSIENQFEFLMNDWVNQGGFAPGIPHDSKDPLIGPHAGETSSFEIPQESGPAIEVRGFAPFVTTRGGAYLFYPSIAALTYISSH